MSWIGIHIYYNGNRIKMMNNCISPLISILYNENAISSFFFINYHSRGRHIRLRLKPHNDTAYVLERSQNYINTYLINNSSKEENDRDPSFFPLNSVLKIDYEPEVERYGGEYCIQIAEKQFEYSSDVVMDFFRNLENESYNDYINISIRLHLVTAFVLCGGNIENAVLFFRYLFSRTQSTHSIFLPVDFESEKYYSDAYLSQQGSLSPFISNLWDNLQNNINDCRHIDINKWRKCEEHIYDCINTLLQSNLFDYRLFFECKPVWEVAASLIHMTNNRIGIENVDEPLISYYIYRALKDK